jgi:hypothetical protein
MMGGALAAGLIASPLTAAMRFDRRARGFDIARAGGQVTPILIDGADHKGVARAARDLGADIGRVTGTDAAVSTDTATPPRRAIIVGALDKSPLIQSLAASGKIDVSAIRGKWEAYSLQTVSRPMPGVEEALVIVGADKRGAIYGIYDLSQNIGVSPWYWWADVPVVRRENVRVAYGNYVQGSPAVKYRGIFLNNEAPCLSAWTAEKFGGMNSTFYTKVFELLLRLRANYLWPAMWNNAFAIDDPLNAPLADEYGIVMGSSHHEPMTRAHKEWTNNRAQYGNGDWNYVTNGPAIQQFFREGVRRNRDHEVLVTMGMRGDGDVALESTGGIASDVKLIETIVADQRRILGEEMGRPVETVPQVWVIFTEVQKYFDAGVKLPDDVTLMFSDDNVGYIRRLPTPKERAERPGGFGVYHHMDMNGGPYSYKWTNTNPFPKIWEQMNLALEYGADRIWISNIGDLKPLELPIEFFLAMAWDPKPLAREKIGEWTRHWAEREFGATHAGAIASFVSRYAKYNAWRKPELVKPDVFSLDHYREWERVVGLWTDLRDEAEAVYEKLRPDQRDAYYQLVLHPIRGSANLAEMNAAAARNKRFAEHGRASTNAEAEEVKRLFVEAHAIRDTYNHQLAGGKWNHLMDQTYIGYFDWYQPNQNILPPVSTLDLKQKAEFGVSVEGMKQAWPGFYMPPRLPALNSLTRRASWFEVFQRGTEVVETAVTADQPWIKLRAGKAFSVSPADRRYHVEIDWNAAPEGKATGTIMVKGGGQTVRVPVTAIRATAAQVREAAGAWGGIGEAFAIPSTGFRRNVPVRGVEWLPIPDYGRVETAMSVFPTNAEPFADPATAPRLEYDVFFDEAGDYTIDLVTGATLQVNPERELAVAVQIDDATPQIKSVFTPEDRTSQEFLGEAHGVHARTDCRTMRFTQTVAKPGRHVLKVAMVDPTIILQSIIISRGRNLPTSYFGPVPQSMPKGK